MRGFDLSNPPFDRLRQEEVEEMEAALDIAYFPPGEVIVAHGSASDLLHVIIKGAVEVRDGATLEAVLGPLDTFDSRAVVHGAAGEDFVAAEEVLCHVVPRALVLGLIRRNAAFAAFFYAEISHKLAAFADQRGGDGVEGVLRARVRDARHGPAVTIDGLATIEEAGHRMRDANTNALLVRDDGRTGVVTGMNLSKAVVLRRLPLDTPVRDVCHFDVVSVDEEDFVYEALLLMARHGKRRLAIRSGAGYSGFLEDIDLLGLFAGNSQLIPGRIDRARDLAELGAAARDIQDQVERLHRQGLKVEVIAEITSDLNRRLFGRLFEMVAPPSIGSMGALLLMGSEGRGEQTLRTDQDNALLLAEEVPEGDLRDFRDAFSGALDSFGFPPCPGNIMVRNPTWSQPVGSFIGQLRSWIASRDPDAAMKIAIFFDAVTAAGRTDLLPRARSVLFEAMRGERVVLARFAHLIETFTTPSLGVLSTVMATVGVGPDEIDLKRAGIFPIVHGVRTLALEKAIAEPSTRARIDALVRAGSFEPDFGRELVGALRVFMEFRLRAQIEDLRRGRAEPGSAIRLDGLTAADRDMLRDALRIVRRFRETIRVRFNLAAF
ncbi:DUF294 nucleotidyltransferase-like domain-containing protein [Arenibaculum pallidiluteum]|uniref:DUF294 nucleotidyltransferase-like domain-containing protein n=1 Tax=Arenibaculum pallidiluteum TaxID=2812559 RepID=UPI001A964BF8|nr:DUF294 nucleotidyltransferase-like domain-containing protein [Arenibaculum pallidiluteum]